MQLQEVFFFFFPRSVKCAHVQWVQQEPLKFIPFFVKMRMNTLHIYESKNILKLI